MNLFQDTFKEEPAPKIQRTLSLDSGEESMPESDAIECDSLVSELLINCRLLNYYLQSCHNR